MSVVIKRSIGKLFCSINGHSISDVDEDRLYVVRQRKVTTNCSVCGKAVIAEVDGTNEDSFFVTEV